MTDEPSWTTAISEAESASRHLRQATAALDRLSQELQALRAWSETTARLDLAHALTEGSDGGVLQCLVVGASDDADPTLRRTAETLLDRLTATLGLQKIGDRGELLRLAPENLAEVDLRGPRGPTTGDARELYCVVRPGWSLDAHVVARPVVEAVRT